MKSTIRRDGDAIYFGDRWLGDIHHLSYAAGEALAEHRQEGDYVVCLAPVPSGDAFYYANDRLHGFERKTVADLCASFLNGHLADQLRRMLPYYDTVTLLVEGPFFADTRGNVRVPYHRSRPVSWRLMQHILYCLQRELGIYLLQTNDPADSVKTLHSLRLNPDDVTLRCPKVKGNILAAVPGIGPRTAANLTADNLPGEVVLAAQHINEGLLKKVHQAFWER